MTAKYSVCRNITDAVGMTPIVRLDRIMRDYSLRGTILAKCEFMNPSGSMKDRMATQTILEAEESGKLKRGDTVVVLTSGNGGIALAACCAAKGYRLIVTMSEGNSAERRRIIRALGAELLLVPQARGSTPGQVSHEDLEEVDKVTAKISTELSAFRVDQFSDESNVHGNECCGEEIWEQTSGKITSFVAFIGSAGCFTGVSCALKRRNPRIKCYAVEPASAPFLSGGRVTNTSHKIQGGGYSQELPLFGRALCDGFISITDEEAIATARSLARSEGIFGGFSSGANVSAATRVARDEDREVVATVLPDSGLRYLSTDLFE